MDDLIIMIFKTHQGEWLCAQRVRAIVNAIKGTNILLRPVKTSLQRLTRTDKLTRMCTGDDSEAKYTLTDAAQGFYL